MNRQLEFLLKIILFFVFVFVFFSFLECCNDPDEARRPLINRIEKKNCESCHCKLKRSSRIIEKPVARISEYTANTGRIGKLIIKSKLNDHRKCKNEKSCRHFYQIA